MMLGMRRIDKIINKKKKFIALVLTAVTVLVSIPQAAELVWATSAQDKKEEAEDNLKDVENQIEDIENQQQEVKDELDSVRKELSKLMSKQDDLEKEIAQTQSVIEQTQAELEEARITEAEQYEAMKLRIQFMYENSTQDDLWTAILGANGLADLLNRVEYISTIYESDRALTEEYKATVAKVEETEQQLLVKMDELLMQEEAYLGQQAEIETMIADLQDVQEEYAVQLASAKKQAAAYKKTIAEQEEIIRKQKEEEERKRKEEEERKKREEEERKKQEEANKNNSNSNSNSNSQGQNVSGQELVNYALQFVGNPYVWGGNSLTNGCDCSGFVHLVYKHFGYNTVRYSMSFLYEGVAVSREDVQPGDIVIYERKNGIGHVAIYAGNGKIVEAQSTSKGITSDRSIDCREIIGIRRILGTK